MKHLAPLIRRGLEQSKVHEDSETSFIEWRSERIFADAVGLAIIGKIGPSAGVELSAQLFQAAITGGSGQQIAPLHEKLGITEVEVRRLSSAHDKMTAAQIVHELESGAYESWSE